MNIDEARGWLRGECSLVNDIPREPVETWIVRTAQGNAAQAEQAYWVARHHDEREASSLQDRVEKLKAENTILRELAKGFAGYKGGCDESVIIKAEAALKGERASNGPPATADPIYLRGGVSMAAPMKGDTVSFTRENRYIVLKVTDVEAVGLMADEIEALKNICDAVNNIRAARHKPPLKCVVVESDWPEYEPAWQAIQQRCTEKG